MSIYPTQATAPRTAPRRELVEGTAQEPRLDISEFAPFASLRISMLWNSSNKYNYKAKAKFLQALAELDYIHYN